jgi:hypothetical protein
VTFALLWVWIAVVVAGVLILAFSAAPLLGRLGGLRRALVKLQRRQTEAAKLQEKAAVLERTVAEVQQRAELVRGRIAAIAPGSGRK